MRSSSARFDSTNPVVPSSCGIASSTCLPTAASGSMPAAFIADRFAALWKTIRKSRSKTTKTSLTTSSARSTAMGLDDFAFSTSQTYRANRGGALRRTAPHRAALRYSQLRAFVLRRPRRVAAQLTRRAQRPMRIAQQLAREHDHVRLTAAHDRLGLLGTRDQPNRRRRNVRIASNTLGKLHLIARTDRNSHLRRDTAARAIDEVHTVAHEQTRKLDGLINGPTIVAPVRRREAYGQRKPLGPDFPDLTHDAPQESRAILERST